MLQIFEEINNSDDLIYDFSFQIDLTNMSQKHIFDGFEKLFIDCEAIILVIDTSLTFVAVNNSKSETMIHEITLDNPICDYRAFYCLSARVLMDIIRNARGYLKFQSDGKILKVESLYFEAKLHQYAVPTEHLFNTIKNRVNYLYECRESEQILHNAFDFSISHIKKFDAVFENFENSIKVEIEQNDEFFIDLTLYIAAEPVFSDRGQKRKINGKFLRMFDKITGDCRVFFSDSCLGFYSVYENVKKMVVRGITVADFN